MTKVTKAQKAAAGSVQPGKAYPADEALKLVKELAHAKFAESVDVAINLGIDASKSDQVVRGSTVLPNGSGKKVRVAVFTQGANAEAAKAGRRRHRRHGRPRRENAGRRSRITTWSLRAPTRCASSASSASCSVRAA